MSEDDKNVELETEAEVETEVEVLSPRAAERKKVYGN